MAVIVLVSGTAMATAQNAGCATSSPSALAVDAAGAYKTIVVTASGPACTWTASTLASWIQLDVTRDNLGGGTVVAVIDFNFNGSDRSDSILIGNQIIPVTQPFTSQTFTDVPPSSYQFDAVNLLSLHNVTSGCGPSLFCPTDDVSRDQMAVFLVRTVFNGSDNFSYQTTPYFNDVPATYWAFKWIQKLFELGITSGCGTSLYCPTEFVTRDQMAVFVIRARYGANAVFDWSPIPYFSDVPVTDFAFQWVQRMEFDTITSGCAVTMYCPSNYVSRGDMAIFIMRGGFNQLLPPTEPALGQISPTTIVVGSTATYALNGVNTHFVQGQTAVSAPAGVSVGQVTVTDLNHVSVVLGIDPSAALNPLSIAVSTSTPIGNEEAVLPNGLTPIAGPPPTISTYSYFCFPSGSSFSCNFSVTGTGFVSGSQVSFCNQSVSPPTCFAGALGPVSPTLITETQILDTASWEINVTTPFGAVATLPFPIPGAFGP